MTFIFSIWRGELGNEYLSIMILIIVSEWHQLATMELFLFTEAPPTTNTQMRVLI